MPANGGDFFWLCYGCGNRRSHVLIDSGYGQCCKDYSAVMRYIYEAGETVEAVFLTHIDNDHIGGFLRWLLQTPFVSPPIKRIFFNNGRDVQRSLGIGFSSWPEDSVSDYAPEKKYSVGAAVHILEALQRRGLSSVLHGCVTSGSDPVRLAQGASIRWISPSIAALKRFAQTWEEEVRQKKRETGKTQKYGAAPVCHGSLGDLLDQPFVPDSSVVNGASLAFLFEVQGKRLAFLGDAWADECVHGLTALEYSPEHPCEAALVKLSHHGSPHNFSEELARTLWAPCYLISTKQNSFLRAQKTAIARLLKLGRPITVIRNCRTEDGFLTEDDQERYVRTKQLRLLSTEDRGSGRIELEGGCSVCGKAGETFRPYRPVQRPTQERGRGTGVSGHGDAFDPTKG